jgi:uncharacterized protein (TIGR04222 family)
VADWLVFVGCLAVLLAVFLWEDHVTRRAARSARHRFLVQERQAEEQRQSVRGAEAQDELGPVELGLLTGGEAGAVDVLVAGLIADGVLRRTEPTAESPERWAVTASSREPASGLEQEVRRVASGRGLYLWELTPHLLPAVEETKIALLSTGHLRPAGPPGSDRRQGTGGLPYPVPEPAGRRPVLAAAGVLAVLAAVVLAVDGAWVRAALAVTVGGVVSAHRPADLAYRALPLPPVTAKGILAVERARARHAQLDPRSRPQTLPYTPWEARLGVALFGSLDRIHPRLRTDRQAPLLYVDGPGE